MNEPQIDALKDMADGLDWLRDHTLPVQIHITVAKDRAITEALLAVQPLWTADEIARRCVLMRCVGSEGEELFVDGVLAVRFYPAEITQEWKDDRLIITHTQKFKRIQAVKVANEN